MRKVFIMICIIKKIQFNTADTKDCENGCLMLISIASSVVKQELGDFDFQIFNLIAEFNPEIYTIKKLPPKKLKYILKNM